MKQTVRCWFRISMVAIALSASLLLAGASFASSGAKHKPKQTPGGANQVQGLSGKVGDMLFTGYWRFQVQAVHTGLTTYTLRIPTAGQDYSKFTDSASFDSSTGTFTPKTGYEFVAIDCLVKNGQTSAQSLDCWSPPNNTALTDDQGQSYTPIGYDMMTTSSPWTTKPMLQGSSEKMTVLFAVPPGTKLQSMVFSLTTWDKVRTHKDARISLAPPASS